MVGCIISGTEMKAIELTLWFNDTLRLDVTLVIAVITAHTNILTHICVFIREECTLI